MRIVDDPPAHLLDHGAQPYKANGSAARITDWAEPDKALISTHREPAPALPLAIFGDEWARSMEAAAECKGGPVDYVAMALLAAAGSMLAGRRKASPWEGWTAVPTIWAACVGNPSSGKSPTIDAVTSVIRSLEEELNADFPERQRRWKTDKEGASLVLTQWQQDCKKAHKEGLPLPEMPATAEEPHELKRSRLVVNDATSEMVIRISAANDRGVLLFRDELAGWIGAMDKYGGEGADRAMWLQAYDGHPFVVDRVKDDGKTIKVASLSLGVLGGIQPDRLASSMLTRDDDGMAARFLYSWPETRKPTRPRLGYDPSITLTRLHRIVFLERREEPLMFTSAAASTLQSWREEVHSMEAAAAGLFLSWLGKLAGYAVRLALVLDHLRWSALPPSTSSPSEVSADAVAAAILFLRSYALPMARRCFGDAALPEVERDAAALGRWLLAEPELPMVVNARELRNSGAILGRDAERYDAALAELEGADWVRRAEDKKGGPGRKRKDWEVNPALRSPSWRARQ